MIYLDSSVALAQLFGEDQAPPESLWGERLVASRLLQYEVMTRVLARGGVKAHVEGARDLLARVALVDLAPMVLQRALDPFPIPVRTLDALHLATLHFLREHADRVQLASYDRRLSEAARALGFEEYAVV
jgi:predicted nucleic acid-binding protein